MGAPTFGDGQTSHHISAIILLNINGNLTEFQLRSHSIPVGKPTEIFVGHVGSLMAPEPPTLALSKRFLDIYFVVNIMLASSQLNQYPVHAVTLIKHAPTYSRTVRSTMHTDITCAQYHALSLYLLSSAPSPALKPSQNLSLNPTRSLRLSQTVWQTMVDFPLVHRLIKPFLH